MKLEDIEKNKIEKEGLTFSPRFKYDYIDEDEELIGLEILATSEEVYQQHLENKNRLIEPQEVSKTEVLEKENTQLWDMVENLYKQLGFIPQEVVNNLTQD